MVIFVPSNGKRDMKVREMIRLLEANGWRLDRMNGDHRIFGKGGDIVVVPGKSGKDIPTGLEHSILRQAGLKEKRK